MTTLATRLSQATEPTKGPTMNPDPLKSLKPLMAELRACGHRENQQARALAMLARMEVLLAKAGDYVADALDAHEHSDGRELLTGIDALLERKAQP